MDPEFYVVLVVDDDAGTREIIAIMREASGFQVLQAANGLEAVKLLEGAPKPDLILLDLAMPVMDGMSFRRVQLRHATAAEIPVIVVTGSETHQLSQMKASDVFKKPIAPAELIEQINKLLSSVPKHNDEPPRIEAVGRTGFGRLAR